MLAVARVFAGPHPIAPDRPPAELGGPAGGEGVTLQVRVRELRVGPHTDAPVLVVVRVIDGVGTAGRREARVRGGGILTVRLLGVLTHTGKV